MAKCFEVMMDDEGMMTVMECEPKEEMEEGQRMPVESLDEVMMMLEQGFSGGEEEMPSEEEAQAPMDEEQAGFDSVFQEEKGM